MNHTSKYDPRGPLPKRPSRPRKPLETLLNKYRLAANGCWEWTATRNRQGYGVVGIALKGKPVGVPAPRLQWMHCHGEVPVGHVVMHICDNPGCVNPDHLMLGTHIDNMIDMHTKGRAPQRQPDGKFASTRRAPPGPHRPTRR